MEKVISCRELAALMASAGLYAVFDARERGEYNVRHISRATSLPRSQIEFRAEELVPNKGLPVVLYDDEGRRARLAACTFAQMGYSDVVVLAGGLLAWQESGGATASGVNVPSKAFGERIHHEMNVPDITPEELKRLQQDDVELVVLDVRTPEEYRRICIPGAMNVPGGDLILWTDALRRRPSATIVINCAGRTRSIVAAAALQRLGLRNVRSLRNGTMGWLLAGYELEKNPQRNAPEAPVESVEHARELARRLVGEEGLAEMTTQEIRALVDDSSPAAACYLIDVRSEREYAYGHVPGSINVPGGQAVQRADDFIAVRNAMIVFISNEAARAAMAAYWYRRMDFPNVAVLRNGLTAWRDSGHALAAGCRRDEPFGYEAARAGISFVAPHEWQRRRDAARALILDVGSSAEFDTGHIPGARWVSRGWLELVMAERFPERDLSIMLTCPDDRQSVLAARTLAALGYRDVAVLAGGSAAWKEAGCPTEHGLQNCLVEPNDVVLSPSIRGDRDEMQRYLQWETNLSRS